MPIAETPAEIRKLVQSLANLAEIYRARASADPARIVPASNRAGLAKRLFPYELLTAEEATELKSALRQCDDIGETTDTIRGIDGASIAVSPGNRVTLETVAKHAPAVVAVCERIARNMRNAAMDTIAGYRSADWLMQNSGLRRNRLSEGVSAGKIRTKPAPKGTTDREGRSVRILYHEQDAVDFCKPKRLRAPKWKRQPSRDKR